jgi:hypothetical protein
VPPVYAKPKYWALYFSHIAALRIQRNASGVVQIQILDKYLGSNSNIRQVRQISFASLDFKRPRKLSTL